jgi:hypothetical protein
MKAVARHTSGSNHLLRFPRGKNFVLLRLNFAHFHKDLLENSFASLIHRPRARTEISRTRNSAHHRRSHHSAVLILDMRTDNVVEMHFRDKSERQRSRRIKFARPTLNHAFDQRIRLTTDKARPI